MSATVRLKSKWYPGFLAGHFQLHDKTRKPYPYVASTKFERIRSLDFRKDTVSAYSQK